MLDMSVDDAIAFFKEDENVAKKIQHMSDVGLGCVELGRSSNTLSGGEAQRVKHASVDG